MAMDCQDGQWTELVDVESLSEDADAVLYWVSKESQYKGTGGWLLISLQHRFFSVYVTRRQVVFGLWWSHSTQAQ